jgi:zinc transport system substrate-binding protein
MRINKIETRKAFFFQLFTPVLSFIIIQFSASVCMSKKLPVIASIYPIADMVQQVGGEHVDVTFVLPAGASPHTFEPKPSLVKKFSSARIFFMIGVGLEFWADKFVNLAGSELTTVVLSKGVSLIHIAGHHHAGSGISDHESSVANPHIWLDPVIAKSMVQKIVAELCEVDPSHLPYYKDRGQKYLEQLDKLDQMIRETVSTFKIIKFVSFHASWDYFARRYGLDSAGIIEAAPGRNPTPIQVKNIVEMIKKYQIRAVFAEPQLNSRAADVIAREAGVKVLLLDPMGGPKQKNKRTYVDLMAYNLDILKEAME